jgi:hypothetical protein
MSFLRSLLEVFLYNQINWEYGGSKEMLIKFDTIW